MTLAASLPEPPPRDPMAEAPAWRHDPNWRAWVPRSRPWEQCDERRRAALRKAWRSGDLSYKLDPEQRRIYRQFRRWLAGHDRGKRFCLDVARRWGKSTLAFLICVEERIRQRRTRRIAYWCDTHKMVSEIILLEVFPMIFEDCPPELRPEWFPSKNRIVWRSDHRNLDMCRAIELAGLDDPNRARGRSLAFGVVDEAGFIQRLAYVDKSIISKMTITVPDACVIYASTPPWTPAHYFTTDLVPKCQAAGAYHHGTVWDIPRLPTDQILKEIEVTGGIDHPATRRELFAEHVRDESLAVLPEAEEAIRSGRCVYSGTEPDWRNCYVSMDPGWGDSTGILFAWIDFERDKLVIEQEWLRRQAPSSVVAEAIQDIEQTLWGGVFRWQKDERRGNPHRRFTDTDRRLVADLRYDHGLHFSFTEKDNLQAQINRVRNWLLSGRIEIHPRCTVLLGQIRAAVYKDSSRKKFAWETKFGHYDLVSALVYLCRNVEPFFRRNPNMPVTFNPATHHIPADPEIYREKKARRFQPVHEGRQKARIERLRGRRTGD